MRESWLVEPIAALITGIAHAKRLADEVARRSAPEVLFAQAERRGARPRFFVLQHGDWQAVTWSAVAGSVAAIAACLTDGVLEPGERAAIFAPNSIEWYAAAFGIQTARGVMVPVYPASTADQAAYVVEHSEARVLFVATEELLERVLEGWDRLGCVRRVFLLDDVDVAAVLGRLRERGRAIPAAADLDRRIGPIARVRELGGARLAGDPGLLARMLAAIEPDDPTLMLYTSGTTGRPKGVPLTHRNLCVNQADWIRAVAAVVPEDGVDLLWLPMSHIFGFGEACLGNALGFTSYLGEPARVVELMPQVRPSVFMSVPAYWEKLAALAAAIPGDPRAALAQVTGGRLSFALSGGAGLPRAVKEQFHASGVLIVEGYGLTETSPTLTINRPDAFRFDTVGRPLPSVEIRLADDGEILARGESVFAGYHRDPDATRAAFTADGWFCTGDVGRFTADGFLQIVDRKKEILVTAGGKNVPPANIEGQLAASPLVKHAVVYGDGKKYLVAGIWLDDEAVDARFGTLPADARAEAVAAALQELVDGVNEQLARFEQVKRHRVMQRPLTVAGGLLTSTLKVRRRQVYDAFGSQFEELYA
jgi:long-chain acyl-CoA synthetase